MSVETHQNLYARAAPHVSHVPRHSIVSSVLDPYDRLARLRTFFINLLYAPLRGKGALARRWPLSAARKVNARRWSHLPGRAVLAPTRMLGALMLEHTMKVEGPF